MKSVKSAKKRKAVTRDVDADAAIVFGDEFDLGELNGNLSDDSESEVYQDESSNAETEDSVSLGSAEVPPDDNEETGGLKTLPQRLGNHTVETIVPNGQAADEEESDEEIDFRIEKDANGNDRYVYTEIDPDDNSDLSELGEEANTIGNIPLSFYDSYPHIGYNINGKKIMRPATGEALDTLLDSIDIPKGYTGLTDPATGKPLELNDEELQLLRRVQMNDVPEEGYDPYEPTVEWFTSKTETMPLSAAPEPKRRFIPSKHEAKRVMKIVRAIREGRIQPYRPPEEEQDQDEEVQDYDIWANEQARPDHAMHMPAPRLPPPGFDESYHPPAEYLPDEDEKKAWEETDPEDREKDFLPRDHDSLRRAPGYEQFVKEKFDRCLDLYLAPRVRRTKMNIDPESLLPKLPNPDELQPFPSSCATLFSGHDGKVRTLAVDSTGSFLASGGDDGTVRVWELLTGRQLWSVKLEDGAPVYVVRWRPVKDSVMLVAASGESLFVCIPTVGDPEVENASHELLNAGWGFASTSNGATKPSSVVSWTRPPSMSSEKGVHVIIPLTHPAKSISFHRRGDYFVSVSPATSVPSSRAIAIHTLSKHLTQFPFKRRLKGGGTPQTAQFHPSKPVLFVANQRVIRSYDLSQQTLLKIITPGARWISSFDIHPTSSSVSGSDNLIVGSYDRRLLWHDLDLSLRPHKTMRFHPKAVRAVKFHAGRYPLFADASDDGTLQIFHGEVVGDMMSNARIVPLKKLKGHKISGELGVMDIDWHPTQPWIVSAGADGTCRLWM